MADGKKIDLLELFCAHSDSQRADWSNRFAPDVTSQRISHNTLPRFGCNKVPLIRAPCETREYVQKDLQLRRAHSDLASQIAYRYPNPGLPRAREGAIGGTWRHIRQVQGYSGSMHCFIDGLVSLYDQDRFNGPPPPSARRLLQPPYAPTELEYAASKQGLAFPTLDCETERKIRLAPNPKRKGHYRYD